MKTRFLFLLIAMSCISQILVAQTAPAIQWQKSLGGSSDDEGFSASPTTDGGYIITGKSNSNDGDVTGNHGDFDWWVIKLNSTGNIEWQKSLGGSDDDEGAISVRQTIDGGYILSGGISSNDGDVSSNHNSPYSDIWVVKLSSTGTIQWQKSLGGSANEDAGFIQQTTDGGYILTGSSESNNGDLTGNHGYFDLWVVKLDSIGGVQWQKNFGGSDEEDGSTVQQTTDCGYIIAGETDSNDGDVSGNHGDRDIWLLKLSSTGSLQWQKCYGGSNEDGGAGAWQTADGGYILSGYSTSNDGDVSGNHGGQDVWIVKLDNAGNIQWQKSLGGSNDDEGGIPVKTSDGGYLILCNSYSNNGDVAGNHGNSDAWLIKLNGFGALEWQKSYGGSGDDGCFTIEPTQDGGYFMAGTSESNNGDVTGNHGSLDFWVVKLAGTGSLPITLISFTGQLQKSNGLLQWKTSTEINTSYFNIQRSIDGLHFNSIGKVVTLSNSSLEKDYTYTDRNVTSLNFSKLYYRLAETDKDGTINYSKIISIDLTKNGVFVFIAPNPFKDIINIYSAINVNDAVIKITDMGGKLLYSSKQNLQVGNHFQVNTSSFTNGTYILSIQSANSKQEFKVVK